MFFRMHSMGTKVILAPAYLLKLRLVPKRRVVGLEIAQGSDYAASIPAERTSSASQSRTTAAVQDCSPEPSGSPENGSSTRRSPFGDLIKARPAYLGRALCFSGSD